jgi:hypothetical protein
MTTGGPASRRFSADWPCWPAVPRPPRLNSPDAPSPPAGATTGPSTVMAGKCRSATG